MLSSYQRQGLRLFAVVCVCVATLPAFAAESLSAEVIWLRPDLLAWKPPATETAQLRLVLESTSYPQLQAGRSGTALTLQPSGSLSAHQELARAYPYLQDYQLYRLPASSRSAVLTRLKSGLQVKIYQGQKLLKSESLQVAPVVDQILAYDGPLGLHFDTAHIPHFSLWAPTADQVRLWHQGRNGSWQVHDMQPGSDGVWRFEQASPDWAQSFYQFEVRAYSPWSGRFETHRVTDPYSVSLNQNSQASQVIDLNDSQWQPTGWSDLRIQNPAPEAISIYELHLRDFSSADLAVPTRDRGKYTAFSQAGWGLRHLRALAQAGLTHVHLLPVFDIATIPEDPAETLQPVIPAASPDSPLQQAAIGQARAQDAFNWGYDPLHYGVPEGSYSTQAQGARRILEFRQMVQALQQQGLQTIMDVVYNHTHASGSAPQSILDKIVPGYYHRLDARGQIQQSSCCPDTATEHLMMQRLMVDTLVRWARDYKVSGFRFDLMGHHTVANLKAVRQALDQLTLAKDGIDGASIYLYGEGWQFGSLHAILPDQAMHQKNAAGTGIGTFNDRMRDALRGGNFDHATRSDQGWINGLFLNPNHSRWNTDTPVDPVDQRAQLLHYGNLIRLSMAGNLAEYVLTDAEGQRRAGKTYGYRGSTPAAYTRDPQENINYVSAHDNYSLWDQIAAKAPFEKSPTSAKQRAAMQRLGLASVILGQGVPFLHAGSEMLRSKSGDGDSYDSGDWFNALDWSYQNNGWGKGLPPTWRNQQEWPFWQARLTQEQFKPGQQEILETLATVQKLLRIRKETPLLRLQTAAEIQQQLRFLNAESGAGQIPGLIVMHLSDPHDLDPKREGLVVILNANPQAISFSHALLDGSWRDFRLSDSASNSAFARPEWGLLTQTMMLATAQGTTQIEPLETAQALNGSWQIPAYSVSVLER